jgi:DNA-binding transcriptional regulator LsrR (DeoR family)
VAESVSDLALAVAYLHTTGMRQVDIAEFLNITQTMASRLLREVKGSYTQHVFLENKLDDATWKRVKHLCRPNRIIAVVEQLATAAMKDPPQVHLVSFGDQEGGSHSERSGTFASHAAPIVRELLLHVSTRVGVAWGMTLWRTTQALRAFVGQRPLRPSNPLEFVPLCGDPLIDPSMEPADFTSSRIASDLKVIVNGQDSGTSLWLGLVPAFLPHSFNATESAVIDRLIDLVPQYAHIFGPRSEEAKRKSDPRQPKIVEQLDMILTGIGSADKPVNFGKSALLDITENEVERLKSSIHGDIGGVLLSRRASTGIAEDPLIDDLNRRWTGLRRSHLETCVARARRRSSSKPSSPGVCVLCYGRERAAALVECIRQGLVNHIIIDSDLASEVERLHPLKRMSGKTKS